jgi:hypothetical protein
VAVCRCYGSTYFFDIYQVVYNRVYVVLVHIMNDVTRFVRFFIWQMQAVIGAHYRCLPRYTVLSYNIMKALHRLTISSVCYLYVLLYMHANTHYTPTLLNSEINII